MPLKIIFNPNGKWSGGARIPPDLRDMSNLSGWITIFFKHIKYVGKNYSKYISNDRELIGQEKSNIIIELDELLSGLFILRQYLTMENPNIFNSYTTKYNYKFHITIESTCWHGKGYISNKYTFKITSFVDWYNNVMLKKIQQLFNKYALAMSDNVLSEEEREELIRFVEIVAFDVFVIERILISTGINQ